MVCSHVHVEDRVSLKDCLVGANFTVTREGMSSLNACFLALLIFAYNLVPNGKYLYSGFEGRDFGVWRWPALLICMHTKIHH